MEANKKWVLVTGGTRGIGAGVVSTLIAAGYDVMFTYRESADAADRMVRELSDEEGNCHGYQCDMSSVEEVEVLAEKLVQQFGAPYAIVNNAGCTRDALVVRMDHEQWRDIINTNLSSAYYSVRALTTPMMQNGGGCIINMSSVTAFKGNVGQVNYAATKAGLIGMTRSLAVELGRFNIRVNAVAPGLIETEIMEHLTEDQKRSFISNIPLRRMGAIDDVSAMIQFLLGAGGTYVTGQTFVVDGGLTA